MATVVASVPASQTTTNKQRWLYSIANLGSVIPYQAVGAMILFYYTDVKHLPVAWASIAMTIYAIYNAFNNPVLGYLSDNTRSRWGRRIPYLLFCTGPYVVFFVLLWLAPFDGRTNPLGLLVYMSLGLFFWEGLGTAVSTAYYSLFPEMFIDYKERTDVAVRMNLVQTVGLLIGAALPATLAAQFGYGWMGVIFAVIAGVAIYVGLPGMFERKDIPVEQAIPLGKAIRATFVNRSFVTVVIAQTFRFFATSTLTMGMIFYIKYSIKGDASLTTIMLATVFIVAGAALWPWRHFIANRFEARTTTMLAYSVTGISVVPLAFAQGALGSILAGSLVGIGLAGLILMGDVIVADVVDEDAVKTGERRAGMFFGLSSLLTTLSSAIASIVFGILLPAYGYNTALDVQPATVGTGFRIFMSIPPFIGCVLAVISLYFYPLNGERLKQVKVALEAMKKEG